MGKSVSNKSILIIAGLAESLINFRGDLIKGLIEKGLTVHVAAPDLDSTCQSAQALESWGVVIHDVKIRRAGLNPLADLKTLKALVGVIRKISPDIVFAYTIKPVIYGMIAARLRGIERKVSLITGLGYAFTAEPAGMRRIVSLIARGLYRIALAGCDAVVFQNPDDKALFERLGLVDYRKAKLVNGSGINLDSFLFKPVPESEQVRFIMIARLLKDKGVYEYAEAAKKVKEKYPNTEFHLVGWIDANPAAIHEKDLSDWISQNIIIFHGKIDDVRPLIESSHAYVLPSYREGTPRTVLEAMAIGRAVITSDAPGCRETVVDGINGYLVPVQDSSALVQAMTDIIESPSMVQSMGIESRKLAEQKYDVHKVNSDMEQYIGITS